MFNIDITKMRRRLSGKGTSCEQGGRLQLNLRNLYGVSRERTPAIYPQIPSYTQ